jgi:hypothetical protein
MRSKTFLSIAAFIVAFAFSTAFASLFIDKSATLSNSDIPPSVNRRSTSCFKNRSTALKIEVLIKQDVNNGRERGKKLYRLDRDFRPPFESAAFPDYADAVTEYVDASSSMYSADLPRDFQAAWDKHMKAWRDYSDFLNEKKDSPQRQEVGNETLSFLENQYSADINSTWYEVLRVGRSYGANVY